MYQNSRLYTVNGLVDATSHKEFIAEYMELTILLWGFYDDEIVQNYWWTKQPPNRTKTVVLKPLIWKLFSLVFNISKAKSNSLPN